MWKYIKVHESTWKYIEVHESTWKHLEVCLLLKFDKVSESMQMLSALFSL